MKWRHYSSDSEVLMILATSSDKSLNRDVLQQLEDYWKSRVVHFSSVDLIDFTSLPVITGKTKMPIEIKELFDVIKPNKNLVIFTQEHNGYFSAFFKNVIDWLSLLDRNFLSKKQLFLVSVSPTAKEKRIMEEGVINTFVNLGKPKYEFVNFNKYESGNDESKRIEELSTLILDRLI